ncbi:MAG: PHP domain-containing protein [Caldilineaceae bacterium]|nr:PHP domain-containing protein [Caldilineaceae bacterium]
MPLRPMWKVDLHSHTIFSKDCLTRPETAIARARSIGLDKLAITEHDNLAGAFRAKELAPDLIIVGEEIKTTRGELIAYFVKEKVPPGLSPQETIRRLRAQGAVIAIPHPLDSLRNSAMGMDNVLEVIDLVDAIEVRNARCVRAADNQAALALAQEHNLLTTAGSDAHIPFELGHCYVEMPPFEDDPESFIDALHQARPAGKESPFWPHIMSTWAKWRKRIRPVSYAGVLHKYGN